MTGKFKKKSAVRPEIKAGAACSAETVMSAIISELKICSAALSLGILVGLTGCRTASIDTPDKPPESPQSAVMPRKTIHPTVFQPDFQPPAGKNAFDYAYTIYKSSPSAPTGIFTYQGIVFVIVNIDTDKVKTRFPKGPAMLKAKKMLEKHYPLPDKYSLPSRQIECRDYRKQRNFRYVLAYRESDILECCRTAQNK